MSNKLQPVRGTHDILPDEFEKFHAVITTARELATLYGFREMATPIFEATEVFSRSMGETSDVVSKEMFTFQTRGEESVTLRPEFTAGIARAFISNGMQQNLPLKLFSTGPLFRYERPQKGRQRQFHQVNFEWLGDDSWQADVEVIFLAGELLYWLSDTKGWKIDLHINTLGDVESREKYKAALVNYLSPFSAELSEDSKLRLTNNPLRILDSKDKGDREILLNAPKMGDYLSDEAKQRFEKILGILQMEGSLMQKVVVNHNLVRGLDYYNGIVFEFVADMDELGAQNTVLAGGRYDGLIEQMGGKPTPAIGFAAGVERLLLLLGDEAIKEKIHKIVVLPFEEVSEHTVFWCADGLRAKLHDIIPLTVEIHWQGKLSKRIEKAVKNGATHVVILSPEEIERGTFIVKNLETGVQVEVNDSDMHNEQKLKEVFGIV